MELVTGALGSLLPKLGELLKEEYVLQKDVKKKIESLSRELRFVHAVLRKIGAVPPDQLDELVRLWVCDIREVSYDMEDIVDAFLVRIDDGGGSEPVDTNMLGRLLKKVGKLFEKIKNHRKISTLIKDISKKLEEVTARRGRYTLDNIVANPAAPTTIDPRILNLYKSAADLVGIEGPRDELIDMLSQGGNLDVPDRKMKIISVVGFGGLGKTTLVKAVYDYLKPQFNYRAFVPVGQNPDMRKIFRDILIDLDKERYTNSNMMVLDERQLIDELKRFIEEKRCFIVIDDIWDKKSWNLIRCAMQESNCGTRLVITTRISEVATYAGEVYKMQPLSWDNSRKLLYARIVDGEGRYLDGPSAEACEKILNKCDGVPLAIITVASLLASKPEEEWSKVYNSIGFGHEDNDNVGNTRRILSFSYYDLPSHLKACLLYLSIYPEELVMQKNSLIWMWIAEGFIPENQSADIGLFELGERCFNELINRSMIQPRERAYEGCIDACSVHDMVLDLIHQLSSEENFVTVLNGGEWQKLAGLGGIVTRRLALQPEHNIGHLDNFVLKKLRSLFVSKCDLSALWPHLPFLRVLDLSWCMINDEGSYHGALDHLRSLLFLRNHLGSLLHLRYLGIHDIAITKLPKEIRNLKFLQTLDLMGTVVEELPEEVGLLTELVCLRAEERTKVQVGLIGKLTQLQELWVGAPMDEDDNKIQFVKELGLLRELRVLDIYIDVTSESVERALLESLGNLNNIRELHLRGSPLDNGGGSGTSDARSVSYRHLRLLYFECFVFSRLPAWSTSSSLAPNLCYLHVIMLVVKEQDMETLARLPQLRCLKLMVTRGTKLVTVKIGTEGVGYFQKLRFLTIYGSFVWFDVRGNECNSVTIMPSLESLEIDVHVRSLREETLLGFDRLLGFQGIGTTTLRSVTVNMKCGGASISEVEEAEDALLNAAAVHPNHPTIDTLRLGYQEALMETGRAPELITKAWKLADIVCSGHIQILRMPDPAASSSSKVIHLLYTNNGVALLALNSNAVHKLWKWEHNDKNPRDKSSKSVPPILWQPENGILMKNDTTDGNDPVEATACTALSKNDSYLISASGGKVSLFNMKTFKVMTTFMAPPPAATFLAFYPLDNNIIAIGREDSTIQIYNAPIDEVKIVLKGHHKKITGLAFSPSMEVLVSSGADAQLCVWSIDGWDWEKERSRYIKHPSNGSGALVGDTMVQFHDDETHLLVFHESQLAIYDWQLECLCLWFPRDALSAPISSAVYSLGCLLVYAGFHDGAIGIFEAESLTLQCRIAPSAYIPSSISSGEIVYPTVIATHPWKPNQMAAGMSDGAVLVLEPLDTDDVQVGSNVSSEQCPSGDVSSSSGDSQL